MREALVARTGQRFLAGLDSDEAMFRYLMDNAIASKEALNLSVGISLSAEQVAALTCNPPSKPQRLFVENSININSRSFLCVNQNSVRARLWQFSNKMRLEFQSLNYAVSMVLNGLGCGIR